jgi:fibulin 1/2
MKLIVFLFLAASSFTATGLNVVTLRYCCGLGTNYANSATKCDNIKPPLTGIQKADENSCLHSIEVCCKNRKQQLECDQGINDAKSGKPCTDEGFKKDCCDACQLGRDNARTQKACDGLGLGVPFDKAFTDCCTEELTITTTTTTTTTTTQRPSSLATKSNEFDLPPVENVCDIGDVCAQICIPTEDSYRCDCNKGYILMSDGVSCKPEKRALKKGDRCSISNPCDHDCIDTGVAIQCSCRDGYELAKDKQTCKDIDECALNIHECTEAEECVNEEGGYFCNDPNFELESDLNTDLLDVRCPSGYKHNYTTKVCDGKRIK